MSSLRRFPAVLWLPVYVGSVFVLMGSHKRNLLIVGLASLLLACCGARAKSEESDGRLQDTSLADDEPFPGLGLDDATPLGDHPETHDDLTSHDLPKRHVARRSA